MCNVKWKSSKYLVANHFKWKSIKLSVVHLGGLTPPFSLVIIQCLYIFNKHVIKYGTADVEGLCRHAEQHVGLWCVASLQ